MLILSTPPYGTPIHGKTPILNQGFVWAGHKTLGAGNHKYPILYHHNIHFQLLIVIIMINHYIIIVKHYPSASITMNSMPKTQLSQLTSPYFWKNPGIFHDLSPLQVAFSPWNSWTPKAVSSARAISAASGGASAARSARSLAWREKLGCHHLMVSKGVAIPQLENFIPNWMGRNYSFCILLQYMENNQNQQKMTFFVYQRWIYPNFWVHITMVKNHICNLCNY